MSRHIFLKALRMGLNRNVTIGGGEPTLHPNFWELLSIAIASGIDIRVVTNGSLEQESITLAELGRKGVIRAQLSLDEWHQQISPLVIRSFKEGLYHRCIGDKRSIFTAKPVSAGRAASFGIPKCCCDDIVVLPDGEIYGCGCFKQHFGNVDNYSIPHWYQWGCTEGKNWDK